MSLQAGTRLGPYEITAQIGEGGMGEVYQATDTNLKRSVAIKVLPESVAGDPERLARFQREAEVLAALNHPNIAQIHGLEKSDGQTALVMELVKGPTLADRIAQGAIPVDEALPIAKQIAEALKAAHEQGIIHRDLKPANIKLRPDGTVKVLDFGLAKAMEPAAGSSPSVSQSPTITTPAMTQMGMILGTAAYMSPEQARGKPVDKRADIWAFGCVLYEMLTGAGAFGDEDVSMTLSKILQRDPDLEALPGDVSARVRRVLEMCLVKNPQQRVKAVGDVRLALEGAFETPVAVQAAAVPVVAPWRKRPLPVALTALILGVLVTTVVAWSLRPTVAPEAVSRFDFDVPVEQAFRVLGRNLFAFSPDGRAFVYDTQDGLYLRTLDALEPRVIPGTEARSTGPFFSPDGQAVAYHAFGSLWRVALSGGAPAVIAEGVGVPDGASWAADGTIFFGQLDGVHRVPAAGGTPERVVAIEEGERVHGAELLPDGDGLLFGLRPPGANWDAAQVVVQSLATGERTVLVEGGSDARFVPPGRLVYALGNGLWGVAFDPVARTVSGGAVPLVQGVRRAAQSGAADYGVSVDGTLTYLAGDVLGFGDLVLTWVDRDGTQEPVAIPPAPYGDFSLSPDGTRVALEVAGGGVWVYDVARDTSTRLTFEADGVGNDSPIWSPDGTRVAFGAPLSWKRADGVGAVERLDPEGETAQRRPQAFIPEGTALVYREGNQRARGLGLLALDGDRTATVLLDEGFAEGAAALSPDGQWLAYESGGTGRREVYVRSYPDMESRWQISNSGGQWPVWNPAGNELFYRGPTGVMALAYTTEPTFTPGVPSQLFEWAFATGAFDRRMDVSVDGQRFLLSVRAAGDAGTAQIFTVQNWFTELDRLVPTGN